MEYWKRGSRKCGKRGNVGNVKKETERGKKETERGKGEVEVRKPKREEENRQGK